MASPQEHASLSDLVRFKAQQMTQMLAAMNGLVTLQKIAATSAPPTPPPFWPLNSGQSSAASAQDSTEGASAAEAPTIAAAAGQVTCTGRAPLAAPAAPAPPPPPPPEPMDAEAAVTPPPSPMEVVAPPPHPSIPSGGARSGQVFHETFSSPPHEQFGVAGGQCAPAVQLSAPSAAPLQENRNSYFSYVFESAAADRSLGNGDDSSRVAAVSPSATVGKEEGAASQSQPTVASCTT
ncbi:formin-like protein 3 [Schistocerca americana]|uniref:formin-like protein 3 n=1 Tax=Schistocerca americana TaxID=7009 RepID=UPI001F4FC842|nr:formin-like protein 3 [Schistocerca americana]